MYAYRHRVSRFGQLAQPYFVPQTVTAVYNGAVQRQATTAFGQVFQEYLCSYCVADPRVRTLDAQWHQAASTQIDHIFPWTTVRNSAMYNQHIGQFIVSGIAPWGAVAINWADVQAVQVIYNDLDNLHVTCTAHNSVSHKGSRKGYHTKMMMGIPNLVNHKFSLGKQQTNLRFNYQCKG